MSTTGKICGRSSEIEELRSALTSPSDNLEIIGISGYGGVGKTFLLTHVMQMIAPEKDGRLVLWVDAAAKGSADDFMRLLSGMMAPPHIHGIDKAIKKDFFPAIRKLEKTYNAEREALVNSMKARDGEADASKFDRVRQAVLTLVRMGIAFNRSSSEGSKKRGADTLRDQHLEDCAEMAFDLIKPYVDDTSGLWGPLQDLLGMTYNRKVRTQLFDIACDSLMSDLSAMLVGYRAEDWRKLTQGKIKGLDRLLLVIDDFEILGRTLGPFLLGHLLPALRSAKFPTQVVILCRDALSDADPGFEHHFQANTRLNLRLEAFSPEEGVRFLMEAGYTEEKAKEINEQCRGLPFLLTSFAHGRNQDALFYQRFFERTTRWMTDEQRDWFIALCYLDEVNRDTASAMLPGVPVDLVVDWFRHEASIRAANTQHFVVNPLIREMVLQHHRNVLGRKSQDEWVNRGKSVSASA